MWTVITLSKEFGFQIGMYDYEGAIEVAHKHFNSGMYVFVYKPDGKLKDKWIAID